MKRIFLALTLLVLLAGCQSVDRTVSTTGTSKISAEPDTVLVLFSVETSGKTADEASSLNNAIVSKIQNEMDVETRSLNVYEEFDYTNTGRKSKGYKATHSLKINVENFEDVGKVIDKILKFGATRLEGVNFELSEKKQREIKKEALEKASQDAKEKAMAIATGMDLKLGKVASVSDVNYNYAPYEMLKTSNIAYTEDTPLNINPGNVDVNAQVQVVYTLK